jgi:lipoprotein-anchoring transpeptidase ErfK/SrfK
MRLRLAAAMIPMAMLLFVHDASAAQRHSNHARARVTTEPAAQPAEAPSLLDNFFKSLFGGIGPDLDAGATGPIPRRTVSYETRYKPGTVVVNTKERRLYYILGDGEALRYGIGVGRIGFTWHGVHTVTAKREWPDWTPPPQMLRRRPDLPRHMRGGVENPLGARAMYIGSTLYRIHGSNEPETIGHAVSSGCIRLTNDDVIDLYNRVKIGATVVVLN